MSLLGIKHGNRLGVIAIGVLGAALLYGDGAITPAISVFPQPLLDQETAGQSVALVCVHRIRFFFVIRTREFLLDQVQPPKNPQLCSGRWHASSHSSSRDRPVNLPRHPWHRGYSTHC